jgi:uncharacterized protein YcbX
MRGEELGTATLDHGGIIGDRAYALKDVETGRVVSAKNPKKFGRILDFRAEFFEPPASRAMIPPIQFTFPDGSSVRSDVPEADAVLSREIGCSVSLMSSTSEKQSYDEYWPDIDGMKNRDVVTEVSMPPRSFFDAASVHIVTSATLERLRELHSQGRFAPRRFRPNVVVETAPGAKGFVENSWAGRVLRVGEARIRVTGLCSRCVMTTLPQGDLPSDLGILRTAVAGNKGHVGAYGSVERGGTASVGDPVWLD